MPEICRFDGLIFKMYWIESEHHPPHIHVRGGEEEGAINLVDLSILEGNLSRKNISKALKWTQIHQKELLEMWETQIITKLPPL